MLAGAAVGPAAWGQPCAAVFSYAGASAAPPNPAAVAAGDFNGDGLPDLVVSHGAGSSVLHGGGAQGPGTFQPAVLAADQSFTAYAVGDFDGNGRMDFAGVTGATLIVALAQPGGGFVRNGYSAGGTATGIAAADFTLDGRLDLAISTTSGVSLLEGTNVGGAGSFTAAPMLAAGASNAVAAGDFSGDGRPDLAVGRTGEVRVYYAGPGLAFTMGPATGAFGGAHRITVMDLNGDGRLDLIAARQNSAPWVAVSTQTSAGGLTTTFESSGTYAGVVAMIPGDFNGNGVMDVLLHANGATYVWPGTGTGLGTPALVNNSVAYGGLAVADFNLDGKPDWAGSVGNQNQVRGFVNTTPRGLTLVQQPPARTFISEGQPVSIAVQATGDGLTFQWRRDGVDLAPGGDHGFTGVNAATLQSSSARLSDSGAIFECVIAGPCGGQTTRAAVLVVNPPLPTCGSQDFNGDGDFGTDADIEAFFRVLGGGSC